MDDPWANAWGESAKPAADLQSTWSHSSKPSLGDHDTETDIAAPSWATGSGIQWSEPSKDQPTMWYPNEPTKGWDTVTSPYEDLPLGKPTLDPILDAGSSPPPEPDKTAASLPASLPTSPKQSWNHIPPTDDVRNSRSRSSTPASAPTSMPSSPDAFGTFETGLETDKAGLDPWAKSAVSPEVIQQEDVWVSSWQTPDSEHGSVPQVERPVDEWEEARRQKEVQDRHVPPHVLATILDEFQIVANDLWPLVPSSGEEPVGVTERSGIDNVEGLSAIADQLIPQDLTLPQFVQFSRTFTAKHMGESLRLTRHIPTTRISPFALYLASKGSTAWETSLKSRVEDVNDDMLPLGWRVVEQDKEQTTPTTDTKRKGGGLLSFFGRRTPSTPLDTSLRRSESPNRTSSISSSVASTNPICSSPVTTTSARTSFDNAKIPTRSSTPTAPPVSSSSSLAISLADNVAGPVVHSPPVSPDVFEPIQMPSAVSRFLTRFSRGKAAGSSSRNLALSTDDLEFLSDIVPCANDDVDEVAQLKELSNMINSSTLPTALALPLPPPPRPSFPMVTSGLSTSSEPLPSSLSNQRDLLSLLDPPPSSSKPGVPPLRIGAISSLVPSIQPSNLGPSAMPLRGEPPVVGQLPSSRGQGRSSSPFSTTSGLRSNSPLQVKRTPVAIMSSSSTSTSTASSSFSLPPPPIIPPPPTSTPINSQSTATPLAQKLIDGDFSSFHGSSSSSQPHLSSDASLSSVFSDRSLVSNTSYSSAKVWDNFGDDFDDFVSSPMPDPSPPRPPAKPVPLGTKPTLQQSQALPQPPIKHPTDLPHATSRAADHQRTESLVSTAAARVGMWPAPSLVPSTFPSKSHLSTTSSSRIPTSHVNGDLLGPSTSSPSAFPFSFPPPPGSKSLRASTVSHSPLPLLGGDSVANSSTTTQNGLSPPLPLQSNYSLLATPTTSGGLSAQDLSFFEGL